MCEPNLLAQAMWLAPAVALCTAAVLALAAVILRGFFFGAGSAGEDDDG